MKIFYFVLTGIAFLTFNTAFAVDEIHYTITEQNSVTFNWRGTATENSIGFGLTAGAYTQIKAKARNPLPNLAKKFFWEAKLTGLKQNALYYYSIGNSPDRTFRTAPAPGSSGFVVYAQGNIGDTTHSFNTGIVQDLIANGQPNFVVGLGDLALGSTNGKDAIDQHFNDVMAWSKSAAYMPVWGDQESGKSVQDNFKNYKGRFALPNPQVSPGSPLAGGEDWYWFDYGNVRFITLPEPWSGAWLNWKTKADVLMSKAQVNPKIKFIVTLVHRPAYSSGHFTGSPSLKGILDYLGGRHNKYVLNINSHSANYERSFPQHGVIHVTAGTGGSNLRQDGACLWLTCAKPRWSAFRTMHHGAFRLSFTENSINGEFICGPTGGGKNDLKCTKGSVVDSFKIAAPAGTLATTAKSKIVAAKVTATAKASATIASTCTQAILGVSTATSDGGYAYRVLGKFGGKPDNKNFTTQSTLRLFENGVEMKPAHSWHPEIRSTGRGRFSHWSLPDGKIESIRFSAINNSSPKTNNKRYTYCLNNAVTTAATSKPTSCASSPTSSLVVNVKDKGAKGNGSANDTAAIQAAINQVAGSGGTVLVPDGTYMVDAVVRLYLKSNMTLRMSGGAILKAIPTSNANYNILRIENASNVNVIGGKVQGERSQHQGTSGEWGNGVSVLASKNVVIEGVVATDMWGDGFYISKNSSNVTACSVIADNNRRQGLTITAANGVVVKNSIFKNTNGVEPQSGVQLEPNANETITNIQILNSQSLSNKGWGIKLTKPATGSVITNVTLNGNTITGNGAASEADGIVIVGTSGHRVINNIVKNNRQAGVTLVSGATNNTVTGNTVTNNGASGVVQNSLGIQMWDRATKNTVINNTVTGHKKDNIRDFVGGNTITPNKTS